MGPTSGCDLRGAGILVTRPAHQAAGLCDLIRCHGGRPLTFPALEIHPAEQSQTALQLLREPADYFIFISPNAVEFALRLLDGTALPNSARLAAVGKGTGQALRAAGYEVELQPAGRYDSEALLALPALAELEGRRVVIVRGVGGRPVLGEVLRERGAELVYAEVYRRQCPTSDPSALLEGWSQQVDLVTATSSEILDNLIAMLGRSGWPLLRGTPLLVISERMHMHAMRLGFENVLQAGQATSDAIVERLCEWREGG